MLNIKDINRSGEIEVFTRVVNAGTFSEAARRLDMSPSAVSKLIARMETRLGARLLHRSTRRLELTAEGERFNNECLRILELIERHLQRRDENGLDLVAHRLVRFGEFRQRVGQPPRRLR